MNCDAERLTAISTLVVGCALAEVDVLDVVHGTVVTIVLPSTTVVFVENDGTGIVDDGTIAVIGFVDEDIPGTVVPAEDVVTGMLAFVVEARPVTEDFKESEVAGVEDLVTSDEARTLVLVVGWVVIIEDELVVVQGTTVVTVLPSTTVVIVVEDDARGGVGTIFTFFCWNATEFKDVMGSEKGISGNWEVSP